MNLPNKSSCIRTATALLLCSFPACAQIAKDATKYLGNISEGQTMRTDFASYWNHVAPENGGKWAAVEMQRDHMVWTGLDNMASYARDHKIPWTFHTLLWGSAYPSWMASIGKDTLKAEIEEWFSLAGTRYPDAEMVVVINEPSVFHAPSTIFLNALGGKGATGYDGLINAFHLARQAFPKAKLILNDYYTIEYARDHDTCVAMVQALLAANAPIDGIGVQAHEAHLRPLDTLRKYLDGLAATGLPLHITEFDIPATNDQRQDSIMRAVFPLFWTHPRVAGISYFGTTVGKTWRDGTGLIRADGTERPALVWLKEYVKNNPNPPGPSPLSTVTMAKNRHPARTGLSVRLFEGHLSLGMERDGRFKVLEGHGNR